MDHDDLFKFLAEIPVPTSPKKDRDTLIETHGFTGPEAESWVELTNGSAADIARWRNTPWGFLEFHRLLEDLDPAQAIAWVDAGITFRTAMAAISEGLDKNQALPYQKAAVQYDLSEEMLRNCMAARYTWAEIDDAYRRPDFEETVALLAAYNRGAPPDL